MRRDPGRNLTVILAGGRGDFYDGKYPDVEGEGMGFRSDGADLIQEWKSGREMQGSTYKYLTSGQALQDFTDLHLHT